MRTRDDRPLIRFKRITNLQVELLESRRVLAVVPYTPLTVFEGGLEESQQVEISDVDNDGDLDAVALSGTRAVTFLNLGKGQFGDPIRFESDLADDARAIALADFDQDGDADAVIGSLGSQDDATITLHRNEGNGRFRQVSVLATGSDDAFIDDLDVGDLDGDGDLDIVAVGRSSNRILMLFNINNSGRFAAPTDVSRSLRGPRAVNISDVDGDGDNDILHVSSYVNPFDPSDFEHRLSWFENTHQSFVLSSKVVDIGPGARFFTTDDFDNDGDLDVVVPEQANRRLVYLENSDGAGDFKLSELISEDLDRVERVIAHDLDSDGDKDVLATVDAGGKVVWFENRNNQFGPEQIISDDTQQASGLAAGDLDADGDIDVLTTSQFAGTLNQHINDGAEAFTTSVVSGDNSLFPTHASIADFDKDGLPDVLGVSRIDAEIAWYKNLGDGSFGNQNMIADLDTAPDFLVWEDVEISDIDGDDDLDIITSEPNLRQIVWYENDGHGEFLAQAPIGNAGAGILEIVIGDLEGDGDQDILAVEVFSQAIRWYRNEAGEFSAIDVADPINIDDAQIAAGDVDGDGDLDVLVGDDAYLGSATFWFENLDGQRFGTAQLIEDNRTGIDDVGWVDMDGDGDLDSVIASYLGDQATRIQWYANLDGHGVFSEIANPIGEQFIVSEMTFIDLDNDNDVDVLAPNNPSQRVEWFENDGTGGFTRRIVAEDIRFLGDGAGVGDINGDGFSDLIIAYGGSNKFVAYLSANPYDLNGDREVDVQDINRLCSQITDHSSEIDLNADGTTNLNDLTELLNGGFQTVVGDSDLDGYFSTSDLVAVFQANEFEDHNVGNSTWSTGDWNCDGDFTTGDLVYVFVLDVFTPNVQAVAAAVIGSERTRLGSGKPALQDQSMRPKLAQPGFGDARASWHFVAGSIRYFLNLKHVPNQDLWHYECG